MHVLRAIGAILALFGPTVCNADRSESPQRPNIVLIFADDLGYGDVGCYGATKVQTPNIDRLASQGRRFTDAHAASAVCTPSRYALLTGQYPFRRGKKGVWGPIFMKTPLIIDTQRLTVARLLQDAGYTTACIGKWHLGFGTDSPIDWNKPLKPGPLELGFDYYFGVPVVSSHPPFVYVENHHVVGHDPNDPLVYKKKSTAKVYPEKFGYDWIGGAEKAHKLYDDEKIGLTLTEKAVQWIEKQDDKPFFLYLATTNIHTPFTPAKQFQGTSQCGRYGDFIHELDWIVGQVLDALDKKGVADNTLVLFTSDNGGMLNQGGQDAWTAGHRLNGKLLGFKFDAWEGGHRVPFIARWPGKVPPGTVSDQLVSNIDVLATAAEIVGRKLEKDEGPDSYNILPALTGSPKNQIRDHLIQCPSEPPSLALRRGRWLYLDAQGNRGWTGGKPGSHIFGGPAAMLFTGQTNSDIANGRIKPDAPPAQLYDLKADPRQRKNVYREHPDVVKRMDAFLNQCRKNTRTAPRGS
ncbi:MAG: sulfatase-like hydrolase/transferase [Pirellulales bacterium]|nr:sulfatase-like hydrolase/transferase [Pirellulales bacterium]